MTTKKSAQDELRCCVDYCESSHEAEDGEIVSNYKCGQKTFTNADMWKVQKRKKQLSLGREITIH